MLTECIGIIILKSDFWSNWFVSICYLCSYNFLNAFEIRLVISTYINNLPSNLFLLNSIFLKFLLPVDFYGFA